MNTKRDMWNNTEATKAPTTDYLADITYLAIIGALWILAYLLGWIG